jgi:regulator of replication initiation timing
MGNIKNVMRQISNKLKNLHQNKPSINDIINEVEQFKFKEKRLRDRLQKSHDKFDYLIKDSNMIQKRIDIKCQ